MGNLPTKLAFALAVAWIMVVWAYEQNFSPGRPSAFFAGFGYNLADPAERNPKQRCGAKAWHTCIGSLQKKSRKTFS